MWQDYIYMSYLSRIIIGAGKKEVQFSCSVMFNSLLRLQHARPPCPSPTARVHPNPCPLSQLEGRQEGRVFIK